jgi:hypothetical protein
MKEDSTKDSTYALVKQLNISDNGNKSKIHLNYSLQSKNKKIIYRQVLSFRPLLRDRYQFCPRFGNRDMLTNEKVSDFT